MNPAEFANIASSEKNFWWYRGMRSILFRMTDPYLKSRKVARALEAGCGTGYFARLMQMERRLPLVALDLGWEGLRHARIMGVENPVQGDMTNLPFGDAVFDLLISLDAMVHLPRGEEPRAVRELARVLKPGGLMVIRAAAFDWLRSRHSEFVFERQRYTRRQLTGLMTGAGVQTLRCTYANSLLLPVAAAKFRLWEPLTRARHASGVEQVPPWLDRLLYTPLAVEAACIGAGLNFPLGQSLIYIGEKRA
jgi:SAM-dependent methyltransferase